MILFVFEGTVAEPTIFESIKHLYLKKMKMYVL